ncbi:uncharacterized protein Dana_GF11661 [Drosophila ananassae]|uniref:Uncharacterized protein n=1 Tax=Drosophila ananassae TaxID=7217 RepID=B3MIE7_DROAN|nr:uncharacterized protein LOC6494525 isoform X2 [Drosophila ananassae]EDV36995.2 uncharacterized protein Dana_GF11661 [Drosophila ananassae]
MSWHFFSITALLLVAFVNSAPQNTVPQIRTNGFQLEPLNKDYFLRIEQPDGTIRQESVQQNEAGNPHVTGVINQPYADHGAHLVLTYEAGPNGYVAKYSYGKGPPTPPPVPPLFLSPQALKTATG